MSFLRIANKCQTRSAWVSGGIDYFRWRQRFVASEAEAALETETAAW
jgi:hypothetical protein